MLHNSSRFPVRSGLFWTWRFLRLFRDAISAGIFPDRLFWPWNCEMNVRLVRVIGDDDHPQWNLPTYKFFKLDNRPSRVGSRPVISFLATERNLWDESEPFTNSEKGTRNSTYKATCRSNWITKQAPREANLKLPYHLQERKEEIRWHRGRSKHRFQDIEELTETNVDHLLRWTAPDTVSPVTIPVTDRCVAKKIGFLGPCISIGWEIQTRHSISFQ